MHFGKYHGTPIMYAHTMCLVLHFQIKFTYPIIILTPEKTDFLDWIIKIFKFSVYLAKKYHVINNERCKIIKPFWCLFLKTQIPYFLKLNCWCWPYLMVTTLHYIYFLNCHILTFHIHYYVQVFNVYFPPRAIIKSILHLTWYPRIKQQVLRQLSAFWI